MLNKGINTLLFASLVMVALFVIAKVQDALPAGARKLAMSAMPVPTGVTNPKLQTLLMVALIILLGEFLSKKFMNGRGARKAAHKEILPGAVFSDKKEKSLRRNKGSQKFRLGNSYNNFKTNVDVLEPRIAHKGGMKTIGSYDGRSCGMPPTVPIKVPPLVVEGSSNDAGPMYRKQIDSLASGAQGGSRKMTSGSGMFPKYEFLSLEEMKDFSPKCRQAIGRAQNTIKRIQEQNRLMRIAAQQ